MKKPGTEVDAPLREMAELMGREIRWHNSPPTAWLMQREVSAVRQ